LDEKYKTTSFFGVKLLKYPFGKKIILKNTPQKRHRFEKKNNNKKKKNGGLGLSATHKPLFFFFGKLHP
jgi:hypothetical protein